jgi:hypothetical protein
MLTFRHLKLHYSIDNNKKYDSTLIKSFFYKLTYTRQSTKNEIRYFWEFSFLLVAGCDWLVKLISGLIGKQVAHVTVIISAPGHTEPDIRALVQFNADVRAGYQALHSRFLREQERRLTLAEGYFSETRFFPT